jgi:hypothetical protein
MIRSSAAQLDRRIRLRGAALLAANCILVNGVLLWLARADHHGSSALVLALGNLIVGFLGVPVLWLVRRVSLPIYLIATWSIAYCITYFSFVSFPALVPLSLVMIAQALAPTIAVLLAKDFRKDSLDKYSFILRSYPVALLLLLAAYRFSNIGLIALAATLLLTICFSISQWSARKLARVNAPFHICSAVSLLNGLTLTSLLLITSRLTRFRPGGMFVSHCLILAIGIIAIQSLYLAGIRFSGALASSLLLAAGVPVSVLLESLLDHRLDYVSCSLSLVYLIITCLTAVRTALPDNGSDGDQSLTISHPRLDN